MCACLSFSLDLSLTAPLPDRAMGKEEEGKSAPLSKIPTTQTAKEMQENPAWKNKNLSKATLQGSLQESPISAWSEVCSSLALP